MAEDELVRSQVQQFNELLMTLHKGELIAELVGNFTQVIEAVKTRKKAGSLTLKLEVMPAGKDQLEEDVVQIKGTTSIKLPGIQRGANIWFVLPDGSLSRIPPNQATFFGAPPRVVGQTVIQRGAEYEFTAAEEAS